MVDSPRSVASNDSGQGTGKIHATKDKQCQYCQQRFTSSSLGRHLDQFIFRKKPDGIHDVDEIRRLRGGITRRTARGNANSKPDSEGSHPTPHTTSPVTRDSSAGDASRTDLNATPVEGYRIRLNAPNWQSTGVINGLPGSMTASPALEKDMFSDRKRKYSSIETAAAKDILGLRGDLGSEKDTARALELALREVLHTIRAAQASAAPVPSPFTIDIQSHSFPSLVLHLLSAPPTLLTSPTPFATPTSFPISSPPNQTHLRLLESQITTLTKGWKTNLLQSPTPPSHADRASYYSHLTTSAESYRTKALQHINLAYAHHSSLSQHQQQETWQIELARAFALEKQKRQQVEERLEAVMAEARHLSGQVEYLSRCQWPREMALWPPDRRPISGKVIEEMESRAFKRRKTTMRDEAKGAELDDDSHQQDADNDNDEDQRRWDYDTLVDKWKKIVREDALRKRGLIIPPAAPIPHAPPTAAPIAVPAAPPPAASDASTTTLPAPSSAKTEDPHSHDQHQHNPPPFEPGSEKPKFFNGEDSMVGNPISSSLSSKQQQQQQQQSPRASNLRADSATDRPAQADDVDVDVRRDAGHHQHHISHDHACGNAESSLPRYDTIEAGGGSVV